MTNTDNGPLPQYRIETHLVEVTFFEDFAAKTRRQEAVTLPMLAEVIQAENRIEKKRLPWLKLGVFGDIKSKKGSLRHDANMLQISGVEVEHDAGTVTFDQAVEAMAAAGVRGLVYTSPSHLVPDEAGIAIEKWRILAPTSQLMPTITRTLMAARINGVIGGVATAESFALSQSFFFGSVKRNPEHRVAVIDGEFIDLCDDLDEDAIGAPEKARKTRDRKADTAPGHKPEDIDAMLEHCRIHMHSPDTEKGWRERMLVVTAALVSKLWTDDAIREKCGPSCVGGAADRDLDALIRSARERFEIPNPVDDDEFVRMMGDIRDEAEAAGVKAPGYRSKERARLDLTDFYAFLPTHQYILRHTGELWLAAGINAALPKVKAGTEEKKRKKKDKEDPDGPDEFDTVDKMIPPALWLDHNRPVAQMSWMPGMPELIEGEVSLEGGLKLLPGACIFNMYQAPVRKAGDPSRAGPWLELVWDIYPDHAEHILDFMAHRIQLPHDKINHALVLTGSPGIGKDTMLEPLKHGVGPWNFKEISPQDITDKNNDYMKSVVLRISEARDLGEINKFKIYETMKTVLAAPPDMVRVNVKYVPQYYVVNATGTIITTNYPSDGLYLPVTDRRHYVCGTEASKDDFDPDYWTGLWKWYGAGGIWDAVAYLAARDLSEFDAKAPPLRTPAFLRMVDGNVASEVPWMWDVIDKLGERRADGSVIPPTAITLDMVREACAGSTTGLYEWLTSKSNHKLIHHRFDACGYVPVRNTGREDGYWIIGGERKVVYGLVSVELPARIEAAKALRAQNSKKTVS